MRILACAALGLLAASCWAPGQPLVAKRASAEFPCPEEKIDVEMISGLNAQGRGATFIARGCGKRATYIRADMTAVLLDSPIQTDGTTTSIQ